MSTVVRLAWLIAPVGHVSTQPPQATHADSIQVPDPEGSVSTPRPAQMTASSDGRVDVFGI